MTAINGYGTPQFQNHGIIGSNYAPLAQPQRSNVDKNLTVLVNKLIESFQKRPLATIVGIIVFVVAVALSLFILGYLNKSEEETERPPIPPFSTPPTPKNLSSLSTPDSAATPEVSLPNSMDLAPMSEKDRAEHILTTLCAEINTDRNTISNPYEFHVDSRQFEQQKDSLLVSSPIVIRYKESGEHKEMSVQTIFDLIDWENVGVFLNSSVPNMERFKLFVEGVNPPVLLLPDDTFSKSYKINSRLKSLEIFISEGRVSSTSFNDARIIEINNYTKRLFYSILGLARELKAVTPKKRTIYVDKDFENGSQMHNFMQSIEVGSLQHFKPLLNGKSRPFNLANCANTVRFKITSQLVKKLLPQDETSDQFFILNKSTFKVIHKESKKASNLGNSKGIAYEVSLEDISSAELI